MPLRYVFEEGAPRASYEGGKEESMGLVWTVLAIIGLIVVLQAIF